MPVFTTLLRAHRSVRPAGIQGRARYNIPRRCSCCPTEAWDKCGVRAADGGEPRAIVKGRGRFSTRGSIITSPMVSRGAFLTLQANVKCTAQCRSPDLQIPPIAHDTVYQGQHGDPDSSSPRMIYTLSKLSYLNCFVNAYFDIPRRFLPELSRAKPWRPKGRPRPPPASWLSSGGVMLSSQKKRAGYSYPALVPGFFCFGPTERSAPASSVCREAGDLSRDFSATAAGELRSHVRRHLQSHGAHLHAVGAPRQVAQVHVG